MNIFLVGAGTSTSQINQVLTGNGHTIVASFAGFETVHISMFDYKVLIVVSAEGSVMPETLRQAVVDHNKTLFIFAETGNALGGWAQSTGVKTYQFPPSEFDLNDLLQELKKLAAGNVDESMQYRRMTVGSDVAARIQGGMVTRKIAVTSPKGGAGKTTTAVNLATVFALCGINTNIVDCDANGGAMSYHFRLTGNTLVKQTLTTLLRRQSAIKAPSVPNAPMSAIAAGGAFYDAFTPLANLPTLRCLSGLTSDELAGDGLFNNAELLKNTMQGLYDVGANTGGVTIMDIGINPTHPLHAYALQNAEAIAIVITPEIPDISFTRSWIKSMVSSLARQSSQAAAIEFISSRVKIIYNMVDDPRAVKEVHAVFQETLRQDGINVQFAPNAILPFVSKDLSRASVNSADVRDILVWRYLTDTVQELAMYTGAMVDMATHFVPVTREAAQRVGLIPGDKKKEVGFPSFPLAKRNIETLIKKD